MIKKILLLLPILFSLNCTQFEISSKNLTSTSTTKIVGGQVEEKYPNVVAVHTDIYLCTGSIIHPQVILTAGHCVYNRNNMTDEPAYEIQIGTQHRGISNEIYEVSESIAHEEWKKTEGDYQNNDIALLILKKPITGHEFLPLYPMDPNFFIGNDLLAIGYGVSDGIAQTGSGIKRSVVLEIDQALNSLFIAIKKTEITQDACQGDSGGPGLINIDGRYGILGIVSSGPEGCPGYTFYVSLYSQIEWIDTTLQQRNIYINY